MSEYHYYSKYGNKKCKCLSKHIHDSRGEAGHCDWLLALTQSKEIKSYRGQVKYPLIVNGRTIANHFVDFEVENIDGSIEVHEFKGFATREWKLKKALFEVLYPDIPYIVVKGKVGRR